MLNGTISDIPGDLVESGSGEPVLLVHGSASDRRSWVAQHDGLSEQLRVISSSRRYHWPNEPPAEGDDYSMVGHVDDLQAVVEHLDAGPVHVVGHSYGGFVAVLAAIRHPALVRSLILIEPPVVPLFLSDPPRPGEVGRLLVRRPRLAAVLIRFGVRGLAPATKAAERGDMDRAIRVFGSVVLGRAAFDGLSAHRWTQVTDNNIRAEYTGSGFASLTADQVRTFDAPTLLVTGRDSSRLWRLLSDELVELLPNARHVEIPDAARTVHEDNPDVFNDVALEFLTEHRR